MNFDSPIRDNSPKSDAVDPDSQAADSFFATATVDASTSTSLSNSTGSTTLSETGDPQTPGDRTGAPLATGPNDKYRLSHEIARGGMGVILEAHDNTLHRDVAMKVMVNPGLASRQRVLRFIEEARITSRLQHPGIMPIHELGVDKNGNVFYTMKRITGRTLKEILHDLRHRKKETEQEYPQSRLLNILQRVCDAVAYAHSKGIIHRDLKPDNIMIGDYGEVLILDWGLAKTLKREVGLPCEALAKHGTPTSAPPLPDLRPPSSDLSPTMEGHAIGTPGYMSPEQAMGQAAQMDERSDIYSLGAILYHMIAMEPTIQHEKTTTTRELLEKIKAGQIKPLPEGRNTPKSLTVVAMKALSLHPADRYQSVKAFQSDIDAYLRGFATSAEQAGLWTHLKLFAQRHRTATIVAAAITCLMITGYVVNVKERMRAENALASFKMEQAKRQKDRMESAPGHVATAKVLIEQARFSEALTTIETAIEYDDNLADAQLLHALALAHKGDFTAATAAASRAANSQPPHRDAPMVERTCRTLATDHTSPAIQGLASICISNGVPTLGIKFSGSAQERLATLRAKVEAMRAGCGQHLDIPPDGTLNLRLRGTKELSDISQLRGIPLTHLDLGQTAVSNLTPLAGMPLKQLRIDNTAVTDLSPLQELPLTLLDLSFTRITDLAPLRNLKLQSLSLWYCTAVPDISPIKDMPLTYLKLNGMTIRSSDLTALKKMPLTSLDIRCCPNITDLTPLKDLPITDLALSQAKHITDISPLRDMPIKTLDIDIDLLTACTNVVLAMKSLELINGVPTAEFWKKFRAAGNTPRQ